MAYNVLKGAVEGSVDQHGDQEIGGVKVFKNTISASVFYDTDAQSPCATIKDVAINKVAGETKNGLLTWQSAGTVRAHYGLTFDGDTLQAKAIVAERISGNAAKLTAIPPDQFSGKISADSIHIGKGLVNLRNDLQVQCGPGLALDDEGVKVAVASTGGLSIDSGKLAITPSTMPSVTDGGQNLTDGDLLLVADISRATTTQTTLSNFYENYIKMKAPQPNGAPNDVQLKTKTGFGSSPNFSYDTAADVLKVKGRLDASNVQVAGTLHCAGAVVKNIKNINERMYVVQDEDYTIVCDTSKNPVDIMLPPACNHHGRILNFKKVNSDKFNLKSLPITLKVQEGTIDRHAELLVKNNYGLRCLQSDGANWWVVGAHSS